MRYSRKYKVNVRLLFKQFKILKNTTKSIRQPIVQIISVNYKQDSHSLMEF